MTINPHSVGAPLPPSYFEQETTSAIQNSQVQLGIMPDSLEKPVSQLNYFQVWKYSSDASSPFIMPLNRLRIALKYDKETTEIWTRAFAKLVEMLKEDAKAELIRQIRLPKELRDPAFGSLDRVLGWLASAITLLEECSIQTEATPRAGIPYADLDTTALEAGIKSSSAIINGAKDYLNQVGHANPNFDQTMQMIGFLEETINSG